MKNFMNAIAQVLKRALKINNCEGVVKLRKKIQTFNHRYEEILEMVRYSISS